MKEILKSIRFFRENITNTFFYLGDWLYLKIFKSIEIYFYMFLLLIKKSYTLMKHVLYLNVIVCHKMDIFAEICIIILYQRPLRYKEKIYFLLSWYWEDMVCKKNYTKIEVMEKVKNNKISVYSSDENVFHHIIIQTTLHFKARTLSNLKNEMF